MGADGSPGRAPRPVIGPFVLLLVGLAAGAALGGWAGLVAGALIALGVVAAVVAGAAIWAEQIGSGLDPADARASAPCPPGFRRLCERVYRRLG